MCRKISIPKEKKKRKKINRAFRRITLYKSKNITISTHKGWILSRNISHIELTNIVQLKACTSHRRYVTFWYYRFSRNTASTKYSKTFFSTPLLLLHVLRMATLHSVSYHFTQASYTWAFVSNKYSHFSRVINPTKWFDFARCVRNAVTERLS